MSKSAKFVTLAMLLAASTALAQGDATTNNKGEKQPQKDKQAEVKKLSLGDRAPELAIQTWVKGDPITGFEKGRVYVVEFWATWCGPCIAGMPHVTEIQKEYKSKGVTVIGVNIWDDPANVAPFMKDRGAQPNGDTLMGYTVAIEKKDNPDDVRHGVMSKTWMEAAGRNGIPSAFIVDQKGTVAWMGHPSQMDTPLKEVVAGTWSIERAKDLEAKERAAAKSQSDFNKAYQTGNFDEAFKIAREHVATTWKDNAMMLNTVAWYIVDPEKEVPNRDLELATKAADRANELTKGENPMILDTVARVYFLKGNVKKAYELQEKAVKLNTEAGLKDELEGRLAEYKKALK
jgi:thiol-disulfide isomerase/thioredoxin